MVVIGVAGITGCLSQWRQSVYGPDVPGATTLSRPARIHPVDAGASPVTLVKDGEARSVVVIPVVADPVQQRQYQALAEELQALILRATGAKLPVVTGRQFQGGAAIFLGNSEPARKAGLACDDLPAEGIRIRTGTNAVALIGYDLDTVPVKGPNGGLRHERIVGQGGAPAIGTRFAVYDFAERFLGVRFYFPGDLGTIVPAAKDLVVAPVDYQDAPVYRKRDAWSFANFGGMDGEDGKRAGYLWGEHLRDGNGGGIQTNHTYHGWTKLYGETHPEYFALKKDGTRWVKGMMDIGYVCPSNPDVLKREVEHFENFYQTGDRAPWDNWVMYPHDSYIPLLPHDGFPGCECPDCQKLTAPPNPLFDLMGHSELIHGYYVKVAKEVQRRWPDRWLDCGAYATYTLPPTSIETYPGNMLIDLCIMDGIVLHKEPILWQRWADTAQAYRRMTGQKIYVWNYLCWPHESTQAPLHCPEMLARWNRENAARIDGQFYCGLGRTPGLDHLNAYFVFKSMWNPDINVPAALDEYYALCFGPSAPAMKRFHELLIDRWENTVWGEGPMGRVGGLPMDKLYGETYPREIRTRLRALSDEARKAAPAGTDFQRRLEYVLAAYEPFFKEAELYERVEARGVIMYAGRRAEGVPSAEGIPMLNNKSGEPGPVQTRVQVAYDDQALYVTARCEEPNLAGLKTKAEKHDGEAWNDDAIEIFLCPDGEMDTYSQIAINTNGVIMDGHKPKFAGFDSGVDFKIETEIVKGEGEWTMTVRIPFQEIRAKAPVPGSVWRANFIRNRFAGPGGPFSVSPTFGRSNHDTAFFGTIIFTGQDRFREDFMAGVAGRWQAGLRNQEDDSDAWVKFADEGGIGKLSARMSKSGHIAYVETRPGIEVRRGDRIEVVYRGIKSDGMNSGRLEVHFLLADGYGWHADNRKFSDAGKGWHRVSVDLFDAIQCTKETSRLNMIMLALSSPPGSENEIEFQFVRVSPFTAETVK
jgi:hypothetical protein